MDPRKFAPRAVLSAISRAKSELASPRAFAAAVHDYFGEIASRAYERYQASLEANNALDFDDIIMRTVNLFRENEGILVGQDGARSLRHTIQGSLHVGLARDLATVPASLDRFFGE